MVTGLELIPFFLDIAPKAFELILKLIPKKGTSDYESKIESVKSILEQMKPFAEGMKQVDELKQLLQTVEEGEQLVHGRKNPKKLEQWIDSFRVLLPIAMFGVLMRMADNMQEIKQLLLFNQSPRINFHLYFSDEKCKVGYEKFICCINGLRGPEPPFQGVEFGSTDRTDVATPPMQSVPQTSSAVGGSRAVYNPTEHVLKKVVFEALARDDYGKKIVEMAACNVNGVISAERVVQDNQQTDLVIVMATEIFVEQDMIKYLKKKLNRRHVYVKETQA
ncbi:hypothetical protein L6164_028883 [Bauhinia variegata]|uniref:Uncharacterized protein n=1 Tax=Bauhinia variegata TaxID=167791 RepID=A0ACB9L7I3_BAUVA|nr:hypothetical protein L6164_028883 [Bauhinia variegata]